MMEFQNSEILVRQLSNPRIIKAIAQLLVSVCVFYYIFSHSSCCSFILHSSKFYLSAIPLQSLDKRWMFLICNGIFLVILGSSSSSGRYDHPHKPTAEEEVRVFLTDSSAELDGSAVFLAQNEKNDQESSYEEDDEVQKSSHVDHQRRNEEEQGDNSLTMIAEDDEGQSDQQAGYELLRMDQGVAEEAEDDEGQSEQAGYELLRMDQGGSEEAEEIEISIIIGDNEDDEGGNENYSDEDGFDNLLEEAEEGEGEAESRLFEKMSTEELNKRFEDFIRKMKEEVRVEPQQQHLLVVK